MARCNRNMEINMQMHIFLGQNTMILLSHGHIRTDGAALSRRHKVIMAGSERRHCKAKKSRQVPEVLPSLVVAQSMRSSGSIPFLTKKRR